MSKKLTQKQQQKLEKLCCEMEGEGIGDILKAIGKKLKPIVKKVGPVVLKEIVLPLIKKKIKGKGITPAGGSYGKGLKLAGQGEKKKKKKGRFVKGSQAAKDYMASLRAKRKKK